MYQKSLQAFSLSGHHSFNILMLAITFLTILIFALSIIHISHALYFGHDETVSSYNQSSDLLQVQSTTEKRQLYVIWVNIKNNTGESSIQFASSNDSGRTFSAIKELGGDKSLSFFPQLAVTEKGDVYVVWVDMNNKTGDSSIKFASTNDSGKTFSAIKELGGDKSLSFFPQLAVTEKGDVYVVWVDMNNKTGDSNIEFISSNDSGKTFSPKQEIRGGNTLSFSPQISATENGDVHVVWVDESIKTRDTDINFRSSHDDGRTFDERKRLRSNDLLSFSPQMITTEPGGVYVVWTDINSTTAEGQISFRGSHDSGRSFDRVINLNKDMNNLSNSSSPQIATSGNNSAYVVWVDDSQIQFGEILVNDALVGKPISISNKTTSALSPEITVADNGNVYVFWIDKNNAMDRSIHFKRISQYFFNRYS